MKPRMPTIPVILGGLMAMVLPAETAAGGEELRKQFVAPPQSAEPWCYWWWLNGAASREGITRDFEEMKKRGIAGALLFDAGKAGPDAPRGAHFMSPPWRELYRHALREADRCGIALSVNLCSGWNAGGPWVTPEHAAKKIVAAGTVVKGPGRVTVNLPKPKRERGFYRDIAVLAHPQAGSKGPKPMLTASSSYRQYRPSLARDRRTSTRWISDGDKPGMGPTPQKPESLQFDYDQPRPAAGLYLQPYPDCGPKEIEIQVSRDKQTYRTIKRATVAPGREITVPFEPVKAKHFRVVFLSSYPYRGERSWNVQVAEIALLTRAEREAPPTAPPDLWTRSETLDLTTSVDEGGRLTWEAPAGSWEVLRIGYTLHGKMTKCVGSGPGGLEIDTMSAEAMEAHFDRTGAKLIADAGPLAGKTLQYLHIDSWELGQPTWTPEMRRAFRQRRGYDPLPYLPALFKRTVDDPQTTRRFLADFRRTAADLVAANYYGRLREMAVRGGLRGIHPESGGPFFRHWIDPLQCEGVNDIPMGEFWKRNAEPAGPITWPPHKNPSVKQAACAAHIYGKAVCQAEAFTSFARDWTATPWNMKDIGDEAFCHGLTRMVLCFWVHQPRLDAKPGFQWPHVGTHFDCNLTWWPMSGAWLRYLSRCQHMLRQGLFVADVAYLQEEAVPGFIAARKHQQPALPPGFDYDVLNAEVLLKRADARNGRLVLPDGMGYRYLVLPHRPGWAVSPAVLRKVRALVEAGVTVVGPPPERAVGLTDFPRCDEDVRTLSATMWGANPPDEGKRTLGKGRILWGRSLQEILRGDGIPPDVRFRKATSKARFDWIHRRRGEWDIYFVSNQAPRPSACEAVFRVRGKQPELWDPVTGAMRPLPQFHHRNGLTAVPMAFAPRQSLFVIFHEPAEAAGSGANFPDLGTVIEIEGPWDVSFNPTWGGPEKVVFDTLVDWTRRREKGIRYYSGTAVYHKRFDLPPSASGRRLYLDLGKVENVARVKINGQDCGVVWTAPWRVEVTGAVRQNGNALEIEVANLWPNRLIGDGLLEKEKRLTVTNVKTYHPKNNKPAALLPSGLLGPVTMQATNTQYGCPETKRGRGQ